MPDLWGIDDEKQTQRIQKLANEKLWLTRPFWIACLTSGVVTSALVALLLSVDIKPDWLRGGIGGGVGGLAASFVLRWYRKALLPPILQRDGRCTKCGYDLANNVGGSCPECGQEFASSK